VHRALRRCRVWPATRAAARALDLALRRDAERVALRRDSPRETHGGDTAAARVNDASRPTRLLQVAPARGLDGVAPRGVQSERRCLPWRE
jgi:hypothetical protein